MAADTGAGRRVWAIGDLHLSAARPKPMEVFGPEWADHPVRIAEAWRERIDPGDVVLIPGDVSWAMTLEEARADLAWIARLPGTKVLVRGNHDYWWAGIGKVRRAAPPGLLFIQNDAVAVGPFVLAGTRGWEIPVEEGGPGAVEGLAAEAGEGPEGTEGPDPGKIYRREIERLRLSLAAMPRVGRGGPARRIVLMHFPPLYRGMEASGFTEAIDARRPEAVVYGHLHGGAARLGFAGERRGTRYLLASADAIAFRPVLVAGAGPGGSREGDAPDRSS